MPYKLAIFDLDGTVLNTIDDLADAVNHVLALHGFPSRTLAEVRAFVGNGARKLIERAVPCGCGAETVDKVLADFQIYYAAHSEIKTRPYNGIPEALGNLRATGCRLAVLSNKPDKPVQTLCKKYFDGLLDYAAGEKSGIPRKPAPDGVDAILKQLGIERSEAVYIGDSEVDIDTAKNSGTNCISVSWGFRDAEMLKAHGAKCIVSDAAELERAILK